MKVRPCLLFLVAVQFSLVTWAQSHVKVIFDTSHVYRQTLAAAADHSVVFCSVGALSSLEDLLNSVSENEDNEPTKRCLHAH